MANIMEARKALVASVLEGTGHAARAQRRAAFNNMGLEGPLGTLIEKVARRAHQITDEDIAAVRAAGLSEEQIFEIVICGAVGQAIRQHDQALAALEAATRKG